MTNNQQSHCISKNLKSVVNWGGGGGVVTKSECYNRTGLRSRWLSDIGDGIDPTLISTT